MSDKEIDVKVSAEVSGLKSGMDEAAKTVESKSNLINDIMKRKAEEAAAIARKQADEVAEAARKQGEEVEKAHKAAADRIASVGRDLQSRLISFFSIGAIVSFVKSSKDAVIEAESAFRGLEAVANYSGVGIGKAMQKAQELASDGMMTVAESSKALQNLLSRGYDVDQAVTTINQLKDAAAFNRQASLEMGEAVVGATEGLKNENSMLVDNAGVTKNVSVLHKEYAASIGKTVAQLTQQEKIQAEVAGITRETAAQSGNAAKAMSGMQGQSARATQEFNNMKVMLGERLTPAFTFMAQTMTWITENVFVNIIKGAQLIGAILANLATSIGIVWDAASNLNFDGVSAKLKANHDQLLATKKEIMETKVGDSFKPGADSGARRSDSAAAPSAPTKEEIRAAKDAAKEKLQIALENIDAIRIARLGEIDAIESAMRHAVDMDRASKADLLEAEISFENQRAEVVRASLEAELELAKKAKDPSAQASLNAQIEQTEQIHQANLTAIRYKAEVEEYDRSKRLANIKIKSTEEAAMAGVDADQQAAEQSYALGVMNKEQLLALEADFENRRTQIKMDAMLAGLALVNPDNDPEKYAAIKAQIEELEMQHQLRMTEIKNQAELERNQYQLSAMNSIQSSVASNLQQLMMGQMSLANFMKATWSSVLSAITGELAKMVANWIAKKLALRLFEKTLAMSEITTQAARAGAGGTASFAAAPWPINMAAPAFGAAMAAAAMAFAPAASAAGGYDIPAGANPVTQLHAREMVLPAKHADVIRSLADGGSGADGGGSFSPIINISAMDASGVRDFLMTNQAALVDALRNAHRNGMR